MKSYAIGFLGALGAITVACAIWYSVQTDERPGLFWGGTVYATKAEFNAYLRSKGLSYKAWLARNPGVAPWESSPSTNPKPTPRTNPKPTPRADERDWKLGLLFSLNVLLVLFLCSLLLVRRKSAARWQHPIPMPMPTPTPRRLQASRVELSPARGSQTLESVRTGAREGSLSVAGSAASPSAEDVGTDRLQDVDRGTLREEELVVYAAAAFLLVVFCAAALAFRMGF